MLTADAILRGALVLQQPARGYRFSVDPLLLADFVAEHGRQPRGALALLDIGAGCGVLGLALLLRAPQARLTAVELQPRLAELARRNILQNGLGARAQVIELDVADPVKVRRLPGARFDWIVSNPPYRALGRGATNPEPEAAIARHELRLPLARLCAELRRLLKPGGQAGVVYPAARLDELMQAIAAEGLSPRVLRAVHPRAQDPATRVLLLCDKSKTRGQLHILAPLIERGAGDARSEELQRIVGEVGRADAGSVSDGRR